MMQKLSAGCGFMETFAEYQAVLLRDLTSKFKGLPCPSWHSSSLLCFLEGVCVSASYPHYSPVTLTLCAPGACSWLGFCFTACSLNGGLKCSFSCIFAYILPSIILWVPVWLPGLCCSICSARRGLPSFSPGNKNGICLWTRFVSQQKADWRSKLLLC